MSSLKEPVKLAIQSPDPDAITAASKSNLAFTFFTLPSDRRRDMAVFYAFCRLADDLADRPGLSIAERQAELLRMRRWIDDPDSQHNFAKTLHGVMKRRAIDPQHFHAILDGVERDFSYQPFQTFDELLAYCYLVASEVGLVSIRIFGCQHSDSETYAIQLGYALQLTNILRDVGEDLANGHRIYLPLEDLDGFCIAPNALAQAEGSRNFLELMEFQYQRARQFFEAAEAAYPRSERHQLIAAEIMRHIYAKLLATIRRRNYPVISQRVKVGLPTKLACVLKALLR